MENQSTSVHDSPQYERMRTVETSVPIILVTSTAVVPEERTADHTASSFPKTSSTRRFAPDAIIASLVGLAVVVFGLIAITRGGFGGSMRFPVVHVLGFSHTTTLGLIEIAIGGCLLMAGATGSRKGALFFGAVLGIGAFVGAVQASSFKELVSPRIGRRLAPCDRRRSRRGVRHARASVREAVDRRSSGVRLERSPI